MSVVNMDERNRRNIDRIRARTPQAAIELPRALCGRRGSVHRITRWLVDADAEGAGAPSDVLGICGGCHMTARVTTCPLGGSGAERIAAERRRQVEIEGYSDKHDDDHESGEIARAAVGFIGAAIHDLDLHCEYPDEWDHIPPRASSPEQSIRLLEKAGALIAAEIDRRLRIRNADEHDRTR